MDTCAGILEFVEQSLRGVRQASPSFLGDQWTCFWDSFRKDFDKSCKRMEHEVAIKHTRFHSPDARDLLPRVTQYRLFHSNLSVSVL